MADEVKDALTHEFVPLRIYPCAVCGRDEMEVVNGVAVLRKCHKSPEAVVWADEASPFNGTQVKNLLLENESLYARIRDLGAKDGGKMAVDWEQRVKEKFPDACQFASGNIYRWQGNEVQFLGYSWQHAAHHPEVIGGQDGR